MSSAPGAPGAEGCASGQLRAAAQMGGAKLGHVTLCLLNFDRSLAPL